LSETEEMEDWAPSFICSLKCDKCVERVVDKAPELKLRDIVANLRI
jgi:hypothetical protein